MITQAICKGGCRNAYGSCALKTCLVTSSDQSLNCLRQRSASRRSTARWRFRKIIHEIFVLVQTCWRFGAQLRLSRAWALSVRPRSPRSLRSWWRSAALHPSSNLTSAQRNAIYQEVHKGAGKVTPDRFATDVGAVVPPMIDLYTLPDDLLANNPATQLQVHRGGRSGSARRSDKDARDRRNRFEGQGIGTPCPAFNRKISTAMKTPSPNRPRKRRSLLGQCSFRNELSIEERIEILNTDINMPDIDGYAMAK